MAEAVGEHADLRGLKGWSARKDTMMFKKILIGAIVSSLLIVSLTACGIREASTTAGPTVQMGTDFFFQPSITIHTGDMLTLLDDSTAPHLITNGSWVNGVAKPGKEAGAPAVYQAFNGSDSATIGPFNTPGTYHLYCTIHQSMNLTVVVTV
jgi:plastocyanin